MAKNSLKKSRRKVIPHYFQKGNRSTSNTSLSQLLCYASYKKRINDLVRNNRTLAVALQEARIDAAYQQSLLKDYARDCNQVQFARLKIREMNKTILKLVNDLEEVSSYLEVDWASNNKIPPKNGSPRDRIRIKAPSVECIEEEGSLTSPEKEECTEVSEPALVEMPFLKPSDNEDICENQPNISECDVDLAEMPPILFIDNSKEKNDERKSSNKSSRRFTDIDQRSLTPELDIDFSYLKHKRSNSRRQTGNFGITDPRSTRSKGKIASSEEKISFTPKRSISLSESVANRKLSLPLKDYEQYSETREAEGCKISEISFVNKNKRGSKNEKNSPELNFTSVNCIDHNVNIKNPTDVASMHFTVKTTTNALPNNLESIETNHTLILCEDMELTEVIPPVREIKENFSIEVKPSDNSDIKSVFHEENKELDSSIEKICLEKESFKLTETSDGISVNEELHFQEKEEENSNAIEDKDVNFCKNSETFERIESFNKHSISPLHPRSTRLRKDVKYKLFFSSSESDEDPSPLKPEISKKSNNINRDTVIFKPNLSKKTSNITDNPHSTKNSLSQNKVSEHSFSVYELDVSSSEHPKKSKQKSQSKKSAHKKEISKPLLQNCNVTKLKGVNYKFTKNETSISKLKEDKQQSENCKSLLDPVTFIKDSETGDQSTLSHINVEEGNHTALRNENVSDPVNTSVKDDSLSSGVAQFKPPINLGTPKELKRVSFAPTDLVCNFRKMSVSKTIAANKKIKRTSKSTFEIKGLNEHIPETNGALHLETNTTSETVSDLKDKFNFYEETELYTFPLYTEVVGKADLHQPSEANTSAATKQAEREHNKSEEGRSLKKHLTVKNKLDTEVVGNADLHQPSEATTSAGTKQAEREHNKGEEGPSLKKHLTVKNKLDTEVVGNADLHQPSEATTSAGTKQAEREHNKGEEGPSLKKHLTVKNKPGKLSLKRNKNSEKKAQPRTSGKIDKDIHSPKSLSWESGAIKPKHSLKKLPYNDLKENVHTNPHTLDISQQETQIKSNTSNYSHLSPIDKCCVQNVIDDIKAHKKVSLKKDKLSQKHKILQPSPEGKTKKISVHRISVECSPVLKDVVNFKESTENRDSTKRRSKVVSYREPSLNKKLRRN